MPSKYARIAQNFVFGVCMNISVIGTGYVGLVSGTCFAEMGNKVSCVDVLEEKINNLKEGKIPIYEPSLESLVIKNYKNGNLSFTTSLKDSIINSNIVFIAVGTPMGEDGSADLQYVLSVAKDIGENMQSPLVVVNKSTVPVGTASKVREVIEGELQKRGVSIDFSVASNPEFLKEGDAVNDFLKPDRIVVGAEDTWAKDMLRELYMPFNRTNNRLIIMDIKSAEMTKYAANAMLATKISFMNEIANICEAVGANVNEVRIGIGSDNRIGYSFIYPGCGYGGSCFPKDVKALSKIALDNNVEPKLINAVELVNENQKKILSKKIVRHFGENLEGRTFAIWGLSFKPETDDMREASSIVLIDELLKRGAKVQCYDPKAMEEAKKFYLKDKVGVSYADNKYDALNNCDALVLVTEWKEFRSPDFSEIKERLKEAVIFDGRNQYSTCNLDGIKYYEIGVKHA